MKTLVAVLNFGDITLRIFTDETGTYDVVDFYNKPIFECCQSFDQAIKYACQEAGIIKYAR